MGRILSMLVRVNTKPKIPLILQTIFRGLVWTEFYLGMEVWLDIYIYTSIYSRFYSIRWNIFQEVLTDFQSYRFTAIIFIQKLCKSQRRNTTKNQNVSTSTISNVCKCYAWYTQFFKPLDSTQKSTY